MKVKLRSAQEGISHSERQDFESIVHRLGYCEDDFEIDAEVSYPDYGVEPLARIVTIAHKRSGIRRTYANGRVASWLIHFQTDLFAGIFGNP